MPLRSAGLLIHRGRGDLIEVLLVHPGGPYWRKKNEGAWQIPKGLIEDGESAAFAARREAQEELGVSLEGALLSLGELKQVGGKLVKAFALAADIDPELICSNLFEMEWPPRSGRRQSFPEVDAARWFGLDEARVMMLKSQRVLLDRLQGTLRSDV